MSGGAPEQVNVMIEALQERAWTIGKQHEHGNDLEIELEYKGAKGRLWIFAEPWQVLSYRVDLGEPTDQLDGCAVWERDESHSKNDKAPLPMQAAFAPGWTAVTIAHPPRLLMSRRVTCIFDLVGRLHFAESAEARRQYLRTYCQGFRSKQQLITTIVVGLFFLAVAVAASYSVIEKAASLERALLAIGLICVPISLFGVILVVISVIRWGWTKPRASFPALEELRRFAESSGSFEGVKPKPPRVQTMLPYPPPEPMQSKVKVPVVQATLTAKGREKGSCLVAEAFAVEWPEKRREECHVVPDKWLTLELVGFPERVASVPVDVPRDVLPERIRLYFFGPAVERAAETLGRLIAPEREAYR